MKYLAFLLPSVAFAATINLSRKVNAPATLVEAASLIDQPHLLKSISDDLSTLYDI